MSATNTTQRPVLKQAVHIVWFKRDLRIEDHAPLANASVASDRPDGPAILPLYIVEPDYWAEPFASRRHWHFIHDCLTELRDQMAQLGQPLVVRTGDVVDVFNNLSEQYDVQGIYAHEENGNGWTFERDKRVLKWCKQARIPVHEYPTNGVVRRLGSRDNWARIRNDRMTNDLIAAPNNLKPIKNADQGLIPTKEDPMFGDPVPGITQSGGRKAALAVLDSFLNDRASQYLYHISSPGKSETHCSRLSSHLTWGTLSVNEILKAVTKRRQNLHPGEDKRFKRNLSTFSSRLAWRCHFIQKIEDQPDIEFKCMHSAFEGMREHDHNEEYFDRWVRGQTGYPLIDACMRNLTHEGWITFRMRAMLVSFASYHLWLDWRKTGHHLAKIFTDYEPGIHYSQLQMQSGVTGINTIRIYSPIKQSQDQDPDGHFIKKWVPELEHVPPSFIHMPWKMDYLMQAEANCRIGEHYPEPIVDHKEAVKAAREKLSVARKSDGFRDAAGQVYKKLGSRKRPPKRNRKPKNDGQLDFNL